MTESAAQFNELLDSIFQYGTVWVYVALFAFCFIENIFPPFPGDMFVLAAGGLVAVNRLMPLPTFLVVIGGGMCSVMLLYYIGRRYGREYVLRKNFKYFSESDLIRMEHRLAHWGWLILLVSRFVPGVRSVIALAAGVAKYPELKMVVLSTISYCAFAGLQMILSMKLISNLDTVVNFIALYYKVIWPIIIVVVLVFVVVKYRQMRRNA